MVELPISETIIFGGIVLVYLAAAIVGVLKLASGAKNYGGILRGLILFGVILCAALFGLRATAIRAIPLTGLFESMIVLTIVFGLVFLFFSIAIKQVWFGSVMVWVLLIMTLLAGVVAKPASEPRPIAATPWAIAHGIAMVLSGVLVVFATANAFLYLLSVHRLKQKKVMKVLGKIPNTEKLKNLNVFGLKGGFVLMTFGYISYGMHE